MSELPEEAIEVLPAMQPLGVGIYERIGVFTKL